VIHPDNREMAERAGARIVLDVGESTSLSKNITESYRKIGGGICEVNAAPGFACTWRPPRARRAMSRPPVINMLFRRARPRACDRAITGTNGKTHHCAHRWRISPRMGRFTPGLTPPTASTSTASARCRAT